jgi:hypothetical protein
MHHDDIDEMLTGAVPIPHPGRRCGPGAESSRSLTEISPDRDHVGHPEGPRGDSFLPGSDRAKRDDPGRARDAFSDDVAAEILSKTSGTEESGDDFLTSATRAAQHAVRTVAAEFRDPTESAGAIIAGVLRGAGQNEDTALKTLSLAARAVIREALLLGYGPKPWIEGILSGAIDGTKALGLHRENAISAAAQGVLRGAEEAGLEPADAAGAALAGTIHALMAEPGDPTRVRTP